MKPLISVVIPVYQAEKYLDRCMEGLLCQTYENYEIILVDDGSSDGSGEICERYAAQNGRVRVLHQKNQGPGPARNHGVKAAGGEWITFVDADDAVATDYLAFLQELLETYGTEIAVVGGVCVENSLQKRNIFEKFPPESVEIMGCTDALNAMCYGEKFGVAPWGKIYRRELLEKNPYPACLHEDLAGTYKILAACDRIVFAKKKVYYYYLNQNSIMRSKVEEKHLYGLTVAAEMLDFMKNCYPSVVPAAQYRCALKIIEYVPRILDGSRESREVFVRLQKEMKKYLVPVLKNEKIHGLFKTKCFAVRCGYRPTVCLWKTIWELKNRLRRGY